MAQLSARIALLESECDVPAHDFLLSGICVHFYAGTKQGPLLCRDVANLHRGLFSMYAVVDSMVEITIERDVQVEGKRKRLDEL